MLILNSEPNHTSDNVINSHTCAYQNYDDETINMPQKLFTFKFLTSWIYLHIYCFASRKVVSALEYVFEIINIK